MNMENMDSFIDLAIVKDMNHLLMLLDKLQVKLQLKLPSEYQQLFADDFNQLRDQITLLLKQIRENETEKTGLRALSQLGRVINSSLDTEIVLQIVMDTIIGLTKAERGFMMLKNSHEEIDMRVARNWEQASVDEVDYQLSHTIVSKVFENHQPILTTNAQEDPRFRGADSVVAYNLRSIMCVPLNLKNELIGVIYVDNRVRSGMFTMKDLNLLTAFADQAAVAIANARLYTALKETLSPGLW
jgi:adenylate cyclase